MRPGVGWMAVLALAGCTEAPVDAPDDSDPLIESDATDVATDTPVVVDTEIPVRRKVVPEVRDVAAQADIQGALGTLHRGRACIATDLDVDGRVDLFVGSPGDVSFVVRNTSTVPGESRFADALALVEDTEITWSASSVDVEGDGDPDLFIGMGGNEGRGFDRLYRNESTAGSLQFTNLDGAAGLSGRNYEQTVKPLATANGAWSDFDRDGDLDLFVNVTLNPGFGGVEAWETGQNRLMRQGENHGFQNVSAATGLDGSRLHTRHSSWIDVDNDGDMDLYESNYRGRNKLWENQLVESGTATFVDITTLTASLGADVGNAGRSFASASADLNNDGWQDLIVFTRSPTSGDCSDPTLVEDGTPELLEQHHLFLNRGPGKGFVDVADVSGFNAYGYYRTDVGFGALGVMGCQVADLNADGLLDLFVGNGGPLLGERNHLFVAREIHEMTIGEHTIGVPMYDDWSDLIDVPAEVDPNHDYDYPSYPYRTHGTCVADYDGDGLPEMYVTNGGMAAFDDFVREPDRLFDFRFPDEGRPDTLAVRLVGDGVHVPRDAVGGRVRVTVEDESGEQRTIYRVLHAGSAFSAQNGMDIFVGLGFATRIVDVEIRWPDGTEQVLTDPVPLNSRLVVSYPQ